MSDDDVFKVQFSGKHYGRSMQNAVELARQARGFTSIEIRVMPHEDYETALKSLKEAVELAKQYHQAAKNAEAALNYALEHSAIYDMEVMNKIMALATGIEIK